MISTLVINCLNSLQRFVDLGWYSANVILDNPSDINNSGSANDRKQGQNVISQDVYGGMCLSQGIITDLVFKLNKGIIMCVRENC